jgi:hypothetical protein
LRHWDDPFAAASGARHAEPEVAAFGIDSGGNFNRYGEVFVMTCREFKHSVAASTLRELAQSRDPQLLDHAEKCGPCGEWLQRQRTVSISLQTLQARTSGKEAGPKVELAVLQAFRQSAQARAASAAAAQTFVQPAVPGGLLPGRADDRTLPWRSGAGSRSTPVALRLSRFFEIGAYAAVAAALLVGVFLGVRLLHHDSTVPAQNETASFDAGAPKAGPSDPVTLTPSVAAATQESRITSVRSHVPLVGGAGLVRASGLVRTTGKGKSVAASVADDSSTDDAGYVALMFCDPLSCSGDSQVVRMELPAQDDASQPQLADVIVGFDGVVRAVRLVN